MLYEQGQLPGVSGERPDPPQPRPPAPDLCHHAAQLLLPAIAGVILCYCVHFLGCTVSQLFHL